MNKTIKGLFATAALAAGLYTHQAASAQTHTVKSGDTLSQLAQTYQVSLEDLAKLNKLKDLNLIYVGQILEISQADKQAASETPAVQEAPLEAGAISESPSSQEEAATGSVTAESSTVSSTAGLSQADAEAKEIIAFKESSGSYTAQNGQYYGRYQLTLSYLNGDLSPENQERVADAYVKERYGSWSAALVFWQANGWY